jgi:hypothetical protein
VECTRRRVDETASLRVTMAGLATADAVRTRMGASARRGMDMSAASRSTPCLFLIARQPELSRNDQYREYGCDPYVS